MLSEGTQAPDFKLADQFGRKVSLAQFKDRAHAMLVFYPLDFTPTWSREIPALEALQDQFRAANTVVLGISVDSLYSHANWAAGMGGVSFPLLADFHPKGAVAKSYGLYLEDKGITDRATVLVDAGGTIRHISSVTPAGERDIDQLLTLCQGVNASYAGAAQGLTRPAGLESGSELFVKSNCGFSRATLLALDNLHAQGRVAVHNVSEDAGAMKRLKELTGKEQAPCLVAGGKPMLESTDIVRHLVTQATGFWG